MPQTHQTLTRAQTLEAYQRAQRHHRVRWVGPDDDPRIAEIHQPPLVRLGQGDQQRDIPPFADGDLVDRGAALVGAMVLMLWGAVFIATVGAVVWWVA